SRRLRARPALKHLVVRAASCGSPSPLVPGQVTLTNVAPVATIADGNARSMPRATKCPRPECGRTIQEDLTMPLRVEPQVQRPRQSASATMEHVHAGGNLYAAA